MSIQGSAITLFLTPRYTPDSVALWRQGIADGWTVERLQSRAQTPILRTPRAAVYGEPFVATGVADALGLSLMEPDFDWLSRLPIDLTRRTVRYGTLADARTLDAPTFVKPADDKCFDAQVYASGDELPGDDHLDGSVPVLMAEPVSWLSEFRCFVLDGRVETISVYMRSGELAQAEDGSWPSTSAEIDDAMAFAGRVLSTLTPDVMLPAAVVLDVGDIDGCGWAVVEANSAWASGIYGCDPAAVLRVLARACV